MNNKKIEVLKEQIRTRVVEMLNEAKKSAKKKKARKPTIEGITVATHENVKKDDVGNFFVVLNATKESTNENIMFETDVFNLAEKIKNGLSLESIRAIVKKQDRAKRMAEGSLKERQTAVEEAKNKANELKNLKGEVISKVGKLKQTKSETIQAVKKLNEAIRRRK